MIIDNIEDYIKEKEVNKIYLDVDGVLLHSCQAMCDIINEQYGTSFEGKEVMSWNFNNIFPSMTDEEIENLFESDLFFDYVEWIEGAREFIKKYEDKIIIITKARPNNYIQKRMLFDLNDLNVPIIPIPLSVSKRIIDMSDGLFIDDSTHNLVESNAKWKIQFLEYDDGQNEKREWIKGWNGDVIFKW